MTNTLEPKEITLPQQLSKEDIEFITYEWNTRIYNYEVQFGVGFQPEPNFKEDILKGEYPNLDIDGFYNYFKIESSTNEEGYTELQLVKI